MTEDAKFIAGISITFVVCVFFFGLITMCIDTKSVKALHSKTQIATECFVTTVPVECLPLLQNNDESKLSEIVKSCFKDNIPTKCLPLTK